jgi:hypothetical protein
MMRVFALCLLSLSAFSAAQPYHVFEENGRYGIKNEAGQVVLAPDFEALGWSDGSFSVVQEVTGFRAGATWGLLHLRNQVIVPAQMAELTVHQASILARKFTPEGWKAGVLNVQGKMIIPFIYDQISLHGSRAIVTRKKNRGFVQGIVTLAHEPVLDVSYSSIVPVGRSRFAAQKPDGPFELLDENGKRYYEGQIQSLARSGNFIVFTENELKGLLNPEGDVLLAPSHEEIHVNEHGEVTVLGANQWMWLTPSGTLTATYTANDILPWGDALIATRGDRTGLISQNREIILPFIYERLTPLTSHQLVAVRDNRHGIIARSGEVIVPFKFDSISTEYPILRVQATEQNRRGWWLLDHHGNPLHTKRYDFVASSHRGFYPVLNRGYWGLLTPQGKEIVGCVYDSIVAIENEQVLVKYRNRYGIIGLNDHWLVAPQPAPIAFADTAHFWTREGDLLMLKDHQASLVYFTTNPVHAHSTFFVENLPDGSTKRINYQGQLIDRTEQLPLQTEGVMPESEGFRGIQRHGKFGFVDDRGRLRIANRYDSIGPFQEGKAPVKLIGKWGFISKADQVVIQPNFEKVNGFVNGRALVKRNGKWGVISENGDLLLPCHYDHLQQIADGYWLLRQEGKLGLADANLRIMVQPKFESIEPIAPGLLRVQQHNLWGVISVDGLAVIPVDFAELRFDQVNNQFLVMKKGERKTLTF